MKIKIVSDGTSIGTKVLGVLEDGSEHLITNVREISFGLNVGESSDVELVLDHVELQLLVNVDDKYSSIVRFSSNTPSGRSSLR